MAMPDLTLFYMQIYGGFGYDTGALDAAFSTAATGLVWGSNPPYGIADFAAVYPKFLGVPVAATAAITESSDVIVLTAVSEVEAGQLVAGPGIVSGTLIALVAADGVTITLSQPTTATAVASPVQIYRTPLIPPPALTAYVALAAASLMQKRWREAWPLAMALYIAHWATMWLLTEGLPGQSPQQLALAAAQRGVGVLTSKSADGVSASYQPLSAGESWGSWGLTAYGNQLVSMARVVGMGPIYVG